MEIQMSINRRINIQTVVYSYNRILLALKGTNYDTCNNTNTSQICYVEQKKSGTEEYTLHDSTHIKFSNRQIYLLVLDIRTETIYLGRGRVD